MEKVTIRLPKDVYENLVYLRDDFGINVSYLMREAVISHLQNNYGAVIREKDNFQVLRDE